MEGGGVLEVEERVSRWRGEGVESRRWHGASLPLLHHFTDADERVQLSQVELVQEPAPNDSVFLLDCFFELFILVGPHARSDRSSIRLALSAASNLSSLVAQDRPFKPVVHVLVLPSRVPSDLKFHFRGLDEDVLVCFD